MMQLAGNIDARPSALSAGIAVRWLEYSREASVRIHGVRTFSTEAGSLDSQISFP